MDCVVRETLLALDRTPTLSDAEQRRGVLYLRLAVAAVGFAMALQMGMDANFVANDLGITGWQRAQAEAVRESCGIVAFAFLAILAGLPEPIIAAGMLALLGVGIGGYAFVPNFGWFVGMSLVASQGLHVWMPLPRSMAMALADPARIGHRMGQVHSAGAGGFICGIAVGLGLNRLGVQIRPLFLLAGTMAIVAGAMCLGIPRQIKTPGPRLVFRRRYGLFYVLSFLEGWRKQIFVCFAGFLLVREYDTPLWVMLTLAGGVHTLTYIGAPHVGRLIDRVGERRVLMFYFGCLTFFFIGYAVIPIRGVLFALFVVDNAFFVFAMALTTYVGRIAPGREHTATLSMGVAMNHVAAVIMPLVGGLLWWRVGYEWTFLVGALAAAVSVVVAMRLPRKSSARAPLLSAIPEPPVPNDPHRVGTP